MDDLFEVDRIAVLKKYDRDLKTVKHDIKTMRVWLKTQPHLPPIDDGRLERILVNCKFSMEKAKRTVDMYFTLRTYVPELFNNRDPLHPDLQATFRTVASSPLHLQTAENERVIIFKLIDDDAAKFDAWKFYTMIFMIEELRLAHDYSNGIHILIDLADMKFGHLTKLTPTVITKAYKTSMECYRMKFRGIYLLHPPPFIDALLRLAKSIVKPKIYQRIHVKKTVDSLHEIIPKDILPIEYGGTQGTFIEAHERCIKALEMMRPWFLNDAKIRVEESKRPEKLKDDLFGSIHGSFRTLAID